MTQKLETVTMLYQALQTDYNAAVSDVKVCASRQLFVYNSEDSTFMYHVCFIT